MTTIPRHRQLLISYPTLRCSSNCTSSRWSVILTMTWHMSCRKITRPGLIQGLIKSKVPHHRRDLETRQTHACWVYAPCIETFQPHSTSTQEVSAELGKRVSSHGTCVNFPKLHFLWGECPLINLQNSQIGLALLHGTLPYSLVWLASVSFSLGNPGEIVYGRYPTMLGVIKA